MENYQKTARAHRALSWFYAFITVIALLVLVLAERPALEMTPFILLLVMFAGLFVLHYFTARAALERKPWARIVSIVICILFLPGFPFGTAIGLLLLSYAWKPWVQQIHNDA